MSRSSASKALPLAGRTAVLSELEHAVILLHQPGFHRLAAVLPFKKDADDVHGHRDRGYPKPIVLLLGVMSRRCRSLPKAEAFFRPAATWAAIREHWREAKASGLVDAAEPDELPLKPIRAGQWRYAVALLSENAAAFELFEQVFLEVAVELAVTLGYFTKGSVTNPDITSCLFADGTELRAQYRSYPDWREDPSTGERRLAVVDPEKSGNGVRAWLTEEEGGRWHAVDPATGEVLRKLPVDLDALKSGKYGPTQAAYNIVPMSVRSNEPNSRVTLTIGADEHENTEAATIVAAVGRIDSTALGGRVQGLITDKIIRGVHMVGLYERYGIVPITKVAAAPREDKIDGEDGPFDAVRKVDGAGPEKRLKSMPLGPFTHTVGNGRGCTHLLCRIDGALVEVDFSEDGVELVEVSRPERGQVKRQRRVSPVRPYHFLQAFTIVCHHGNFTVWLCPHASHDGDDGRHVAENSRVFPEGSEVFRALYGLGRNTSEGGNTHQKDTYPHKRSQASGRIPVLLDVYLYFAADNAKTWYFQEGWSTVDPLLHPTRKAG